MPNSELQKPPPRQLVRQTASHEHQKASGLAIVSYGTCRWFGTKRCPRGQSDIDGLVVGIENAAA